MAIDINIPSQVRTFANLAAFPASGALKTIYIAEDTNKTYRWTGSVYVEVSAAGASGITIGTTAITSGTVGRVLFEGTGNVVQESANLFLDETNGRLGIGTSSPSKALTIQANANDEGILLRSATGLPLFQVTRDGASNNTAELFQYSNGVIRLAIRSASNFSYFNGGNFGFGTTTDAGFRLDVNGTARVQGNLTLGTGGYIYGDTTNPFIRLNNNFGAQFGYGTSYIDIGGAGYSFNTGTNKFLFYRTTSGMRIADSATLITDPQTDGLQAVLALTSTNKGFLPPRMTTTQKNAIASPATGLMVYDNVLNRPCFYDGTTWITL
jgi:hypothetical protein